MLDEIYAEVEKMMNNAMEALIRDLSGVRTGRASTSLVDGIRIDYYGSSTPLNQLASISAPEPRLLMIKPYEQTLIGDIEKAILSDKSLGLNPSNDGQVIRLPIPELTEERRIEMTKIARHRAEEARVAIRQARREGLDLVDDAKKDGDVSEDDARHCHDHVQEMTDAKIKRIDEIIKHKEEEIMEV
ncbi:MAG: ribosome recycling factor [Gemmatimonadetes bacterium]|jgi:ribosome recycling factor|nr:ribosome recycling factor [Gemmatimonadota bacterium]MBT7859651.1 ribosome recycling factor [Gemmatimonadota bacterium]